jgi:hypothetical protein
MKTATKSQSALVRRALSLHGDNDGSALVEGAVVIPVLIALLFGVYEFSWFFYQQHIVSTGLRDAARYLARSQDPCDPSSVIWGAAQERAKNLAVSGTLAGGVARVKGWTAQMVVPVCNPIDNISPFGGPSTYRGGPVVYSVTVSTRFSDPSLGFFGLLGLSAPVIFVAHSERVIGPG